MSSPQQHHAHPRLCVILGGPTRTFSPSVLVTHSCASSVLRDVTGGLSGLGGVFRGSTGRFRNHPICAPPQLIARRTEPGEGGQEADGLDTFTRGMTWHFSYANVGTVLHFPVPSCPHQESRRERIIACNEWLERRKVLSTRFAWHTASIEETVALCKPPSLGLALRMGVIASVLPTGHLESSGSVAELVRASSGYTKVVGLISREGTYENRPINA